MMSSGAGPVMVGVDGSDAGLRAVRWATAAAVRHDRALLLLHANPWDDRDDDRDDDAPPGTWRAQAADHGRAVAEDRLAAAAGVAESLAPDLSVARQVVPGPAARVLVVRSAEAAIVVLGRRGDGGFPQLRVGGTAAQVARHASSPVVVVPEFWSDRPLTGPGVVVGVDPAHQGGPALRFAFEEAARLRCAVDALAAWFPTGSRVDVPEPAELAQRCRAEQERLLDHALAPFREQYPDVVVVTRVVVAPPSQAMLHAAQDARLAVLGAPSEARGTPGVPPAFGTAVDIVVEQASCPVAVAR